MISNNPNLNQNKIMDKTESLKSYEPHKDIESKNSFRKDLITYLYTKYNQYKKEEEYSLYSYVMQFFTSQPTSFEMFLEHLTRGIDVDDLWYLFPYVSEEYIPLLIHSQTTSLEEFRSSYVLQLVNTLYDYIHVVSRYQSDYILKHKFELYELFRKKIISEKYATKELFLKCLHVYVHEGRPIEKLCKKFGQITTDVPNVKLLKFMDSYVKNPQDLDNIICMDFIEYLCERMTGVRCEPLS